MMGSIHPKNPVIKIPMFNDKEVATKTHININNMDIDTVTIL